MLRRSLLVILFLTAPVEVRGNDEKWILFERPNFATGNNMSIFFDEKSIEEMEPGIFEFYEKKVWGNEAIRYDTRQIWIDCKKGLISIGEQVIYQAGQQPSRGNSFKYGWRKVRGYEDQFKKLICPPYY